jgi:hypothetical protein
MAPSENCLSEANQIDILLSHEKRNKMSMVTRPSKQKTFFLFQKIHATIIELMYGTLEVITGKNKENQKLYIFKTNRRSVFGLFKTDRFRFWSRFPAGL